MVVHQLLPASSGGDQQPRANRAAGIRHGQGHQPARAHPSSPRTQGSGGGGERLTPRWRCGEKSSAAAARASGVLTGDGPGSSADVFVVAEPGLNVELNVAAPFRIGAGAGYRFVAGTSLPVVESSALNGFVATLTLKFGRF